MSDWKRIIVDDAFKVSSGINHLRDIFLAWPFLLFSIITHLGPIWPTDHSCAVQAALCAVTTILLKKERLMLLTGALAIP
jgi:hypothetical protein